MQSAFAITPADRTPRLVLIREHPEEPLGTTASQGYAVLPLHRTAVPPPVVYDYATYGVPRQSVYYVEGYGKAFVHQQTGTVLAWVERTQRFPTVTVY